MNINQKTADPSGWVICPSKSFPGKFYYFNVLNGEAAWSLNDVEAKLPKKDINIKRISNRFHSYPEPKSPPKDNINISSTNYAYNLHESPQKHQKFDEPTTIRCSTESNNNSHTIWTPVHFTIHTNLPVSCPNPGFDCKTVHSGEIPLCKRFKNFHDPILVFENHNTVVKTVKSRFETSTPKKQAKFETPESNYMCDRLSSFEISVPMDCNLETSVQNKGAHFSTSGPKHTTFDNHGLKSTQFNEYSPTSVIFEPHHPKSVNYASSGFKTENCQNIGSKTANFKEYNNPTNIMFEVNCSKSVNFASSGHKTASYQNIGPENANFEEYNNPKNSVFEGNCSKSVNLASSGLKTASYQNIGPENANFEEYNNPKNSVFEANCSKSVNLASSGLKTASYQNIGPENANFEEYNNPKNSVFEANCSKSVNLASSGLKTASYQNIGPENANFEEYNNLKNSVFEANCSKSVNLASSGLKTASYQNIGPKDANFDEYNNPKNSVFEANCSKSVNFTSSGFKTANIETGGPEMANQKAYCLKSGKSETYVPKNSIYFENIVPNNIPLFNTVPTSANFETYVPKTTNFDNDVPKIANLEDYGPKRAYHETYVPKTANSGTYMTDAVNFKPNESKGRTNNETYTPKTANIENYVLKAANLESYVPKTADIGSYVPIIDNLETYVPKSANFETTPKICKIFEAHCDHSLVDGPSPIMNDGPRNAPKPNTYQYQFNKETISNDLQQNATLGDCNKVKNVDESTPEKTAIKLDENDLRYMLLAKRRKSQDGNSGINTKKPKLVIAEDCKVGQKRVRFNLEEDNTGEFDSQQGSFYSDTEDILQSPVLEQPPAPAQEFIAHTKLKDVWYIVTDTDILVDKFNFIEELVQKDVNCSLLIPYVVELEIKKISITECKGLQRVINARDLIRKLPTKSYCTVESPTNFDDNLDTTDGILNCCLRAISDGYHLVLITNNLKLYNEAKLIKIPCYNIREIKNAHKIKPSKDFDKLSITLPNDTLQSDKMSVHTYKKQLFTDKQNDNHNIQNMNCKTDVIEDFKNYNENPKITINNTKSTQNENMTKSIQNKSIFDIVENINESYIPLQNISFDNSELSADEIYSHLQKELPFKHVNNIKKILDPTLNYENIADLNTKNTNNYKNQIKVTKMQENSTKSKENNLRNDNKNNNIETNCESVFKIPKNPVRKSNTCARSKVSDTTDMSVRNLNIESHFQMLQVKNDYMSEKLSLRMDEWICTYTQIMEDILNDVIQQVKYMKNQLQYTLTEGLIVIKQCFKEQDNLITIIEKLYSIIINCSCDKGKLNQKTKPEEFMQILSGSIYLIQTLQTILPNYERIYESEEYLNRLVDSISSQELEMDQELLMNPSTPNNLEEKPIRTNFIKERSYVVDHLKKHYTDWQLNYDEHLASDTENQNDMHDVKVFRTLGKHLNMFKIDQNKSMYCSNDDNLETDVSKVIRFCETFERPDGTEAVNTGPKAMKQKDRKTNIDIESSKNTSGNQNIESYPTSGNTFSNTCDKTGPIMIRNLKRIDKFEKQLKTVTKSTKSSENLYINDFIKNADDTNSLKNIHLDHNSNSLPGKSIKKQESNQIKPELTRNNQIESVSTGKNWNSNQNFPSNPIYLGSKPAKGYENEGTSIINSNNNYNKIEIIEDSDDSGFENENTLAHSLVKIFLNELSTSFKVTYDFVDHFVKEIRGETICDERKRIIHDKSSEALNDLSAIIPSLRSIMSRESANVSVLKNLLLKAGIEARSDKRVMRYRQIVAKSLEQAVILENALKIVASITLGDLDCISNNTLLICPSLRYINIFE